MFIVIGLMLTGIALGFLLRKRPIPGIHHTITALIWLLLFLLGLEVGHNDRIIHGLKDIGFQAFAISVASTLGSVLAAWGLWHILYKRKS